MNDYSTNVEVYWIEAQGEELATPKYRYELLKRELALSVCSSLKGRFWCFQKLRLKGLLRNSMRS